MLAVAEEYVRNSFTQALEDYPGGAVAEVCSDSASAVTRAIETRPDVVIVGAQLPPADGFATVQEITSRAPGVSALLVMKDPAPSDYRRALQAGARDMLAIPVEKKDLFAALDAAVTVSGAKRSALEGITARAHEAKEPQTAQKIVIFSTKGGTGKTFLATNLAAGLARSGKRVALIDLDLQFGDVSLALGMVPQRTLFDLVQSYAEFDVTLMREFMLTHTASGLQVLPAPLYPEQGDQITPDDIQTILDVVQDGYEYVIVDTPPFFEERILVALDWADDVVLVGSLDLPTLKNIKLSYSTMDLMAYPDEKLHVLVNRADSRVGLELKDVERHLGRQVWHSISSSIEVPRALNAGEVLLLSKPGSRVGKELAELVALFEQSSTTNNHGRRLGRFRKRGSEDT